MRQHSFAHLRPGGRHTPRRLRGPAFRSSGSCGNSCDSCDFRKLFAVRLVSQSGEGIFEVGLAALFCFSPENSSTATGVAGAFAFLLLPYTVVGPWAGVLMDAGIEGWATNYRDLGRPELGPAELRRRLGEWMLPTFTTDASVGRSDRRVHAAVVSAEGHSGAEPEHPPPMGVREAAWVVTPASYWAEQTRAHRPLVRQFPSSR